MINGLLGPENASLDGGAIDALMVAVHAVALVAFGVGASVLVRALVRSQARPQSQAGEESHAPFRADAAMVVAELLLFGFGLWVYASIRAPRVVGREFVVRVIAERFVWNVHEPGPDGVFGRTEARFVRAGIDPLGLDPQDPAGRDDVVRLNELRVPAGRTTRVRLTAKDVLHGFAIPAMRVKQDAIPGREIVVRFTPTRTGTFEIACMEFCGNTHYRMRGALIVESAPSSPPSR